MVNPLPKSEYGENHHVYPRCLGGNDEPENIVRLTPEEHYRAHYLLPLIYTEGKEHAKLLYAWNMMSYRIKNIDKDAEEYGRLRREYAKQASIDRMGRKASEETKRKQSEALKGREHTAEHNRKVSQSKIGKPLSVEHRKALSMARKGMHLSASHRAAIGAAHKGRKWDAEFCRKVSEAKMGHETSPETRAKISASLRKRNQKCKAQNS